MCLGFITIFCPLNISFPTDAQAKWKISSKTALLRICLIIDSVRRGKRKCTQGRNGTEFSILAPPQLPVPLPWEGSCRHPTPLWALGRGREKKEQCSPGSCPACAHLSQAQCFAEGFTCNQQRFLEG